MRTGESMACHKAMMKDTVENERSPPDIIAKFWSVADLVFFIFLKEHAGIKLEALWLVIPINAVNTATMNQLGEGGHIISDNPFIQRDPSLL